MDAVLSVSKVTSKSQASISSAKNMSEADLSSQITKRIRTGAIG